MPGEMEFGLLGPLVVRRDGTSLALQRGGQRALLAALLLRASQVVSADALAEVLWGAQPPPTAPTVLRNYVRRLRQALGDDGRERIVTHARGYLIRVADGELDLARFGRLLTNARAAARGGSWEQAAAQAQAALGLWRGEPLADVESEVLALREVPRLAELRLQAGELRLEARLHLGGQDEAAAELARLAATHPLREHVHALLMLALYRCGRQADALAAYRNVRQVVIDELGAEPGTELQRLHRQILAADPALDLLPRADPAGGSSLSAADVTTPGADGDREPAADGQADPGPDQTRPHVRGRGRRAAAAAVPRQLPAAVTQFTGRAAELQALTQILDEQARGDAPGTVAISAIAGTAGVGKTALALRFAHQAASRFPDGQLYANLAGFDPGGARAAPAEAVRGLLEALGVPPERIPPAPEAQEGLYRSVMADRRMLIVLDNAADERQVRPLIPASPASLVLVTSRSQLTGLAAAHGARVLTLDVLPDDEARQMLAARIGAARATAEPRAIDEIARLCACLPLALAVAAARAAARPGFPLAALACDLRDASGRLDALDAGDPATSVRTVLSWSYQQLTPGAAHMFRLLGIHPGPDITTPAAASLAGCEPARARQALTELTRAHLITEHLPGRYAFHDLLRAYAVEQAAATDSDTDRHQATGRVLDHYLHTAHGAALLINPARDAITRTQSRPGVAPEHLTDYQQAMTWLQAEHQVLLAAVAAADSTGFDAHVWQIAWTVADFLHLRGRLHECAAIQRTAIAAATRLTDSVAQVESLFLLARACERLAEYDQVRGHCAICLRLYQQLGDRNGEARVHKLLALTSEGQGRYADALDHDEQGLRLYQAIGNRTGEARTLNNIGYRYALLGDYQQARLSCQRSLALTAELGHRHDESYVWDSLGYAEYRLGNFPEAAACYQRALSNSREFGDVTHEAAVLTHLGDMRHAAGHVQQAREAWRQALDILDEVQHPDAEQARAKLAAAARDGPVGAVAAD